MVDGKDELLQTIKYCSPLRSVCTALNEAALSFANISSGAVWRFF